MFVLKKRLLKFVLYYVIGAYVDHDELEVDNFVIFGSEASITLAKVHAKPSVHPYLVISKKQYRNSMSYSGEALEST